MNITLISPPSITPFAPPMSLVALRSYLEHHDIGVTPIDASIDAIHYTLNPAKARTFIEPAIPTLRQGLPPHIEQALMPRRTVDPDIPVGPLDEARAMAVLDALQTLWTPDGFALSRENYAADMAVINDGLILASLRMFPHVLTAWGYNPNGRMQSSGQENPFLHYYMEKLIPDLLASKPDAIGLSMVHMEQMFYTMFLLAQLKQRQVDCPIVLGGAFFSMYCNVTGIKDGQSVSLAGPDAATEESLVMVAKALAPAGTTRTVGIQGEGEAALLALCQRIDAGQDITDLPNLIHMDPAAQTLVFNEVAPALPANDLPPIDLSGFGVGTGGKYLTPIPIAPMMTSRGCYWDKCAFCDHARTLGAGYRELPANRVADTMETFRRDFDVQAIFLCDESLSPHMVRTLTAELEQRDLVMPYISMARIEKAFIPLIGPAAQRGLRALSFGFESACPRMVDAMKKGFDLADADALLDACREHHVHAQLFIMFGFPSETPEEAQMTLDYLVAERDKIWGISPAAWLLTAGSEIWSAPDEFGLTPNEGPIVAMKSDYTQTEGISRSQALEYVTQLKTHPKLQRYFATEGLEDYRLTLELIQDSATTT
jgi:anaerobic magnesium-protoporphyrin IX monomethyl ester cyclase